MLEENEDKRRCVDIENSNKASSHKCIIWFN